MIPSIKKILDLSQPIYQTCPTWPTYAPVNINYEAHYATHGYNAERINMNTHTGTHVDAPAHFTDIGETIDSIDLFKFTGRGVVFDLRQNNSNEITVEHLEKVGAKQVKNSLVILYTGWAQKRGMNKEYIYKWPFLTESAAQWFVDNKVKGVCIDGLSIGGWSEGTGVPPHRVLLENDIVVIEELYIDEQLLTADEWFIFAFPIKLQGCGGAPVRVVAISFA